MSFVHPRFKFVLADCFVLSEEFSKSTPDGELTSDEWDALTVYAAAWRDGKRDRKLEESFPDLDLLFYEIRSNPDEADAYV